MLSPNDHEWSENEQVSCSLFAFFEEKFFAEEIIELVPVQQNLLRSNLNSITSRTGVILSSMEQITIHNSYSSRKEEQNKVSSQIRKQN